MSLAEYLTNPRWAEVLAPQLRSPAFEGLERFLEHEQTNDITIYPKRNHIFEALNRLPPERVQVVLLGQDPYHQPGQAHGLSFSVPGDVKPPPSLVNIFKELKASYGSAPISPDLSPWVDQGVLLLNSVLTVSKGQAGSHQGKGWEVVTDQVIAHLAQSPHPVVFFLWGRFAQAKKQLINPQTNLILETSHPSPLASYRGFFGCNHFVLANRFLAEQGAKPISWS